MRTPPEVLILLGPKGNKANFRFAWQNAQGLHQNLKRSAEIVPYAEGHLYME